MSKIDKIKEQIGWLKIIFGIGMAIEISLIAWLVNNYDNSNIAEVKIYMNVFAIFVVSIMIIVVNKVAFKKINELEDL